MSQEKQKQKIHNRPGAERADIARRVANFRAHQARLQQARDDYYHSVLAQIDKTLGGSRPRDNATLE